MATPASRTTFAAVPPEAADVLRPALPGPGRRDDRGDRRSRCRTTRAPWRARFGQLVRLGVEVALNRFIDMVADPGADVTPRARHLREPRRAASSTRAAASTRCWPPTASARGSPGGASSTRAPRAGLPPDAIYSLGEAIFAYIDEISAESADGYAEEQSAAAGESQRRRRRLIRLLAQDPPASQEAIRTAAQAAAWALPRRLAVLVAAAAETAAGAEASGAPPGGGEPVPGEEIVEAIADAARAAARGRARSAAPRAAGVRVRPRPRRARTAPPARGGGR